MDPFESRKSIRNHLVSLTKELVRFPSHVQEPLKIFELMEFIKSYFEKEKLKIKSFVYGGVPSIVVTFEETRHPNILLSGHVDVVPSSARYTAEEDGDKLRGSGVMDMKGGVACMMALMKYFCREEEPPSIGLMITSDEEIGSKNGTYALLEEEEYKANFVIVGEGREKYDIVIREKGVLVLKLTLTGEFVHSAYPWRTKNALEEVMLAATRVKKLFPKASDKWMPTAAITSLHGGREINTIPGYAEAIVNIRLTGGRKWSRDAMLEKIKNHLPGNIGVEELMYGEVFLQEPKNSYVKMLRGVASKVMGRKVRFGENHGGSDARIFMKHNIPVVALGPTGQYHHTPNEYVDIESLVQHFEVLKTFVNSERERVHKPAEELTKKVE